MAAERTEKENVETVAAIDTKRTSLIPKFFNRLNELPIVKSMCVQVSDAYERTRERNIATQLGFGAAEVSFKTALLTTRLVYCVLSSNGFTEKLKEGFEEKVSKVDTMACDGLDFLLSKWPLIKDSTDTVMAIGTDKLEQSDLVEVILTVTEGAVDYFKPPQEKVCCEQSTDPPVEQTKVDRIRGVSNTIMDGGAEVLSFAASAGLDGAKMAVQRTWDVTKSLFKLSVFHGMLTAFLDPAQNDQFIFSPPAILGGGVWAILVRKQYLRRSKRRKVKGNYRRVVDATNPFPVSPDRKRKYDNQEGEGSLIEELVHVSANYVSDEDPDYNPENDEGEDSVDSLEDEDDDEDEADEDEEQHESEAKISEEKDESEAKLSEEQDESKAKVSEEQDESKAKLSEEQDESKAKVSEEHEASTQGSSLQETTQPKQTAVVHGVGKKGKGVQTTTKNCSRTEKKPEVTSTKAAQVKNTGKTAIGAKKAEAMKPNGTTGKERGSDTVEGRIVI